MNESERTAAIEDAQEFLTTNNRSTFAYSMANHVLRLAADLEAAEKDRDEWMSSNEVAIGVIKKTAAERDAALASLAEAEKEAAEWKRFNAEERKIAHDMFLDAQSESRRAEAAETALAQAQEALRREWWMNHGHDYHALYGDDGEMACNACPADFKRQPISELEQIVMVRRAERANAALSAGLPEQEPNG